MRPGIILQHATDIVRKPGYVRSDVTGFIGVVTKERWPKGSTAGDFLEMGVESWGEFAASKVRVLFDEPTLRAVRLFFENGGRTARIIGVFIEKREDLLTPDAGFLFTTVFSSLLERLRGEEDIGILLMPVLAYLPMEWTKSGPEVKSDSIVHMWLNHCQEMNNRFFILDPPQDLHETYLMGWMAALRRRVGKASMYGACYYPWLMHRDDTFPPSGAVAGVYARVEHEHKPFGVRWPPANVVLRGVTHPAVPLLFRDGGNLTEAGINPILNQPSRGVVIWGARTMSTDPKWLHINSRRIVSFVTEQIKRDSEWVVFENHTPELWQIVRRMVQNRLDLLWGSGLLAGDAAGSDYLVKCDAETNPPEVRDQGQLHVKVILRPIGTTEQIVVELRLGTDEVVEGGG